MEAQRPKVVPAEPVPRPHDERSSPDPVRPRPLARIRVPLTLTVQPWATLYRLPDGRRWWCLRLREDGEIRTRCVSTARLRAYARASRLPALEAAIDAALSRTGGLDAVGA
ncbi:MAG TPA: hypothetical protein VMH90_06225 [Thermoplasmata archaeon]|nr:hypothetical protein [Thermoplasmata archaeon]